MRTSHGIVYTVKVLSEHLYKELEARREPVLEIARQICDEGNDSNSRMVGLGVLSFCGLSDFTSVAPHFESVAVSPDWNMREISQTLFRKLIKKHPDEATSFLLRLAKSSTGYLRRFVGETLRPVQENRWFYKNPEYSLSILKYMFTEGFPNARTSVGNNLSDLARKLPELVYSLAEELVESGNKNSYWIAYRACRNLVKHEPIRVMNLLKIDEYRYKTRIHRRRDTCA
jgi:3-methyladenine DNA glycosylase AlkC